MNSLDNVSPELIEAYEKNVPKELSLRIYEREYNNAKSELRTFLKRNVGKLYFFSVVAAICIAPSLFHGSLPLAWFSGFVSLAAAIFIWLIEKEKKMYDKIRESCYENLNDFWSVVESCNTLYVGMPTVTAETISQNLVSLAKKVLVEEKCLFQLCGVYANKPQINQIMTTSRNLVDNKYRLERAIGYAKVLGVEVNMRDIFSRAEKLLEH